MFVFESKHLVLHDSTCFVSQLFLTSANKFQSVHIAGTKGKGSTAAFLSNILRAEGYSVGCYTRYWCLCYYSVLWFSKRFSHCITRKWFFSSSGFIFFVQPTYSDYQRTCISGKIWWSSISEDIEFSVSKDKKGSRPSCAIWKRTPQSFWGNQLALPRQH